MSMYQLDDTHYDVVIVGTSLSNCILSGVLSGMGVRVLHLDSNEEYGGKSRTVNLKQYCHILQQAKKIQRGEKCDEDENQNQSGEQSDESASSSSAAKSKDLLDQFDQQPLEYHNGFIDCEYTDFTLSTPNINATTAAPTTEANSSTVTSSSNSSCTSDSGAATPSQPAAAISTSVFTPSLQRHFSIDLFPSLLYSRGRVIDLILSSAIENYLEFKSVDQAYYCNIKKSDSKKNSQSTPAATNANNNVAASALPLSFVPLPLSKSSLFQSSSLSILDKRRLMKFIKSITPAHLLSQGGEVAERAEVQLGQETDSDKTKQSHITANIPAQYHNKSFYEYLVGELGESLGKVLYHSVAMYSDHKNASAHSSSSSFSPLESISNGLYRLNLYINSIGRYHTGAFLYTSYGSSELNQSLARLSAVKGGVFMLRVKPTAILFKKNDKDDSSASTDLASRKFAGVLLSNQQVITADCLICDREYKLVASDASNTTSTSSAIASSASLHSVSRQVQLSYCARAVAVVDSQLLLENVASSSSAASGSLSSSSFFCFIPSSSSNESSISIPLCGLQLGSDMHAAPNGYFTLYLWSQANTLEEARNHTKCINQFIHSVAQPYKGVSANADDSTSSPSSLPQLLFLSNYIQELHDADQSLMECDQFEQEEEAANRAHKEFKAKQPAENSDAKPAATNTSTEPKQETTATSSSSASVDSSSSADDEKEHENDSANTKPDPTVLYGAMTREVMYFTPSQPPLVGVNHETAIRHAQLIINHLFNSAPSLYNCLRGEPNDKEKEKQKAREQEEMDEEIRLLKKIDAMQQKKEQEKAEEGGENNVQQVKTSGEDEKETPSNVESTSS